MAVYSSLAVGASVGTLDDADDGGVVGTRLGTADGARLGDTDGEPLGSIEGVCDGSREGGMVGFSVGDAEGPGKERGDAIGTDRQRNL